MKVLEVRTLQAGTKTVQQDLSTQTQQLQQIEQSIQALVDLGDSFTGEGASTIKNFYVTHHLSFLKQLFFFYEEYQQTLSQIQSDLQAFESDNNGYIRESFLENDVTDGLKMIKEKTLSLTDEANDIISSVSDIVSLRKLDESYVLHGIDSANWKREEVIGQLHHFDVKQAIDLQALAHTAQAMIEYVQYISTLFQAQKGPLRTIDSILYNPTAYQPPISMYAYAPGTLHRISAWNNFYLNYVTSNSAPKGESLISKKEAEAIKKLAVSKEQVIDEFRGMNEVSAISGHYYTLADGRILREYYDETNVYRYQFVNHIPEEKIGGAISFEERYPNYAKVEKEVVDFFVGDYIAAIENPSVETIGMAGFYTFGRPVKALDNSLGLMKGNGKKKEKNNEDDNGSVIHGTEDIKNYQYNMVERPGPLAEMRNNPAQNFYGGRYNEEVLMEDQIYYRGGNSDNPLGQWFTKQPPESVAKVRIDTAVKPQWIDPVTGELTGESVIDTVYSIKIPKGTSVYTGPVGPQGGVYSGGYDMMQTFIKEPWKLDYEVIDKKPLK